jgi:phosphoribosylamine--glycine ligase
MLVHDIVGTVAQPVIDEMRRRGAPFVGLLYCGLALTKRGLRVVEFNARFGDPETQVVLARLQAPLGAVLQAAATGHLESIPDLRWAANAAVTVVVAADNYPEKPRTGDVIDGLDDAAEVPDAYVLHAGTSVDDEGRMVSSGGRVLSVVGTGPDLTAARDAAYTAVARIKLAGSHYRSDIAEDAASG